MSSDSANNIFEQNMFNANDDQQPESNNKSEEKEEEIDNEAILCQGSSMNESKEDYAKPQNNNFPFAYQEPALQFPSNPFTENFTHLPQQDVDMVNRGENNFFPVSDNIKDEEKEEEKYKTPEPRSIKPRNVEEIKEVLMKDKSSSSIEYYDDEEEEKKEAREEEECKEENKPVGHQDIELNGMNVPQERVPRIHNNLLALYEDMNRGKSNDSSEDKEMNAQADLMLNFASKQETPFVSERLKGEPYLKLTVIKSSVDLKKLQTEYIVTPRGMVGSLRSSANGDITIGRQQIAENGTRPNDIMLPASDRAISRTHCRVVYKSGFPQRRVVTDSWIEFFKLFHHKMKNKTKLRWLPVCLRMIIMSYLKDPCKFYLTDLGSVYGTYVKISSKIPFPVLKGQTFLVGADISFNIKDVWNDEDSPEEGFDNYLSKEYKTSFIHGVPKKLNELSMQNSGEVTQNQYARTATSVKIEIIHNGGQSVHHLFVATNEKNTFKIGRSQDCDVIVSQHTISREQCRFSYENRQWSIMDGNEQKESANGTWVSLTDCRLRRERQESEPRELDQGMEIKVSDTILKVEWFDDKKDQYEDSDDS